MQGMANGDQATAPGAKPAPRASTAPVETSVQVAGTPAVDSPKEAPAAEAVVEEAPKVTLRPKNVDEYPLSVSVVGVEDELIFENESSTVEVSPEVAAQIEFSPVVEVAE